MLKHPNGFFVCPMQDLEEHLHPVYQRQPMSQAMSAAYRCFESVSVDGFPSFAKATSTQLFDQLVAPTQHFARLAVIGVTAPVSNTHESGQQRQ